MLVDSLFCLSSNGNFHLFLEVRLHEEDELIPRDVRCAHRASSNLMRSRFKDATSVDLESLPDLEGHTILGNADLNDRTFPRHRVESCASISWDFYF